VLTPTMQFPLGASFVTHKAKKVEVLQGLSNQAFQRDGFEGCVSQFNVDGTLLGVKARQDGLVGVGAANVVGVLPELNSAAAIDVTAVSPVVVVLEPGIGVNRLR